jgi:cation transport ATPase
LNLLHELPHGIRREEHQKKGKREKEMNNERMIGSLKIATGVMIGAFLALYLSPVQIGLFALAQVILALTGVDYIVFDFVVSLFKVENRRRYTMLVTGLGMFITAAIVGYHGQWGWASVLTVCGLIEIYLAFRRLFRKTG